MIKERLPTSIRLTEDEAHFLEAYAVKHGLIKPNGNVSKNMAVLHIIREKMNNSNDEKSAVTDEIAKMKSMLEQIHIAIPHIALDSHYSALNATKQFNESGSMDQARSMVNDHLYETYGAFQAHNYDTLYCATNKRNMKSIPIEKDKNKWKLK